MKKYMFLFLICGLFVSCSNEVDITTPESDPFASSTGENITLKNGMLVFPNDSIFRLVMAGQIDIPIQLHFISQQDLFYEIMVAEEEHAQKLLKQETNEFYSDLYNEKLKSGFIKTEKFSDGTELYELNLASPQYAKVLNQDGFYAIGKNIYQVTSEGQKVWINGNLNNYKLLAQLKTSDESQGIYVYNQNIQSRVDPFYPAELRTTIKYTINSNYRYYVKSYDHTELNFPPTSYRRETYVRMVAQKKSGSKWVYNTNFYHNFIYRIQIVDKANTRITSTGINLKNTGGNIYYSLYCHPDWLLMSEVSSPTGFVEYTNNYVYLGSFEIYLYGVNESDYCSMMCECISSGEGSKKIWSLGSGTHCEVVSDIDQ